MKDEFISPESTSVDDDSFFPSQAIPNSESILEAEGDCSAKGLGLCSTYFQRRTESQTCEAAWLVCSFQRRLGRTLLFLEIYSTWQAAISKGGAKIDTQQTDEIFTSYTTTLKP